MIKEEIIGSRKMLTATEGLIHRIGSETYVKSIVVDAADDLSQFEEVDEAPAFTKYQYDEKVAELVRQKYSESEEFAIQRKAINAAFSPSTISDDSSVMTEYAEYNSYVEECKVEAKNPELYKEWDGYDSPES